jgi:hypothetical protein
VRKDTPPAVAPRPAAEPPPARPDKSVVAKSTPRETARPTDAQIAQRAQPAKSARGESERCVELQVRASLGEPVSTAELQKECRK